MSDEGSGAAHAELIEDGGEAASDGEFFRSAEFLQAEQVTHTLRIEAGEAVLLAPLIVREIPAAGERDAISPYGFPGIAPRRDASDIDHARRGSMSDALDPAAIDWAPTGLVSIFIRHTLAEPLPLAGAAERNAVQVADPALPPKSRSSDRNRINKNRRAGYAVEIVPGPETSAAQRAGFLAAYEQTMRRTGAAERYFFAAAYFDRLLESPRSWLALAYAPGGDASPATDVAAASLTVQSDGFLHYYLSGTADGHLGDSPMKNLVAALVELSTDQGLPLNLGGGLAPGDALEEFKRGFANREQVWRCSEIVCDREAYDRLSAGRDPVGFFPAYRG